MMVTIIERYVWNDLISVSGSVGFVYDEWLHKSPQLTQKTTPRYEMRTKTEGVKRRPFLCSSLFFDPVFTTL